MRWRAGPASLAPLLLPQVNAGGRTAGVCAQPVPSGAARASRCTAVPGVPAPTDGRSVGIITALQIMTFGTDNSLLRLTPRRDGELGTRVADPRVCYLSLHVVTEVDWLLDSRRALPFNVVSRAPGSGPILSTKAGEADADRVATSR